jgi:uncharacterized protein YegL
MTEIVFIIDKSGSMYELTDDTIGGFNSTIDKQRQLAEPTCVSTVLFANESVVIHDRVPLEEVRDMTRNDYEAGGCTALLDAVGGAIHHIGNIHKYARQEDVPQRTLFVIITDGLENASRRYSREKVKGMIERQKERYGWEFLFLGANIDVVAEAGRLGIDEHHTAEFIPDRTGALNSYSVVSDAVFACRSGRRISAEWADELRKDVKKRKPGKD